MTTGVKGLFKPIAAVLSAIIVVAFPIKQLHAQDNAAPPQLKNPVSEADPATPTPQRGSNLVRVQGDAAAVQLDVRQTTTANALSALATTFNFSYRSTISLDEELNGTYEGSLAQVISQVLEGYDYVIKHENSNLDVVVFEKSGGQAVPSPAPNPVGAQSQAVPSPAPNPAGAQSQAPSAPYSRAQRYRR
jgi:hypothetical protein